MRVRTEHVERYREALAGAFSVEGRKSHRDSGLSLTRYLWDCYWRRNQVDGGRLRTITTEVYQYANDDHITTVLKLLAKAQGVK